MHIICHNCKQIWELPSGSLLVAKLRFSLGAHDRTFVCPACQAENLLSQQRFHATDSQIPVTGVPVGDIPTPHHPRRADNDPASAPTNPVPMPDPAFRQLHAIVLDKGLRLLRDHNPTAVEMGRVHRGKHIIILDTWTNGYEFWAQLGPERWALVEENGEAFIQWLDEKA